MYRRPLKSDGSNFARFYRSDVNYWTIVLGGVYVNKPRFLIKQTLVVYNHIQKHADYLKFIFQKTRT